MASYLDGLLQKANQILIANSKRASNQSQLNYQQPITNTTRRTVQGMETNNRSQQTQRASLQSVFKQAKAYDPFAVVNKTQEELQQPLTYLEKMLAKASPVGSPETKWNGKYRKPTADEIVKQKEFWKSIYEKDKGKEFKRLNPKLNIKDFYPGSSIKVYETKTVYNTDPKGDVANVKLLQSLNDEQIKYLGKDLSNVNLKTLASADWTGFHNLEGDVVKYNSLRDSYVAKANKTKVDTDWIKQYDTLLADTYKAMSAEVPKILTSARNSYDTISKTRDTTLAAIESLLPMDKQDRKKTMDVSSQDPRSQIANRVKLVNNYATKKPTPVFESRPI